ncbi:MAG: nuclear transport factor 2 family protein [Nitrososphaerales archaeon]
MREVLDLRRRLRAGEPQPRLFELLAPDVQLDLSRRIFNPEVYRGHDGLLRFRREMDEVWEEFSQTPEQIIDAGENVVVIESLHSRGRSSGVELTSRSATVWTVREGQVVVVVMYHEPQEALKAVGLPE